VSYRVSIITIRLSCMVTEI